MMTKIIKTICDACDEAGTETEAESFSFSINRGVVAQLDLCEEHQAQYLEPLLKLLQERGVTEQGKPVQHPLPVSGPGGQTCDYCGKILKGTASMNSHIKSQHAAKFEEYMRGRGLDPQKCPQCKETFWGSQAFRMHTARSGHAVAA